MMYRTHVAIALVFFAGSLSFLVSCSGGSETSDQPVVQRDSSGISIVENDVQVLDRECDSSESPVLSIGKGEGDEKYLLHRVFGATKLSDGKIALVNQGSSEIRLYDSTGTYSHSLGRSGEGPGEFQNAFYLWRLSDNILWTGDYDPWEFEVFHADTGFVRQVRPRPQYINSPEHIGVLADGRTVLASSINRRGNFDVLRLAFVLHDASGALVDTLKVMPNGRWGRVLDEEASMIVYPLFESFAEFAAADTTMILGHGDRPELTIYSATEGFEPTTIIRWTTPDRTVSDSEVEAAFNRIKERYSGMDGERASRFMAPLVHEDRPVAEVKPAFSDVVIGTDGSVWVRRFQADDESADTQWLRFNKSGRYLCETSVPGRLEVYEFGGDYVLGKIRDSVGVERVVEHTLSSSGVKNATD